MLPLGYPIDKVKGTKGLFEMTSLKSNIIIVYMAVCASILSHYDLLNTRHTCLIYLRKKLRKQCINLGVLIKILFPGNSREFPGNEMKFPGNRFLRFPGKLEPLVFIDEQ